MIWIVCLHKRLNIQQTSYFKFLDGIRIHGHGEESLTFKSLNFKLYICLLIIVSIIRVRWEPCGISHQSN
jgi:hypothetical protein